MYNYDVNIGMVVIYTRICCHFCLKHIFKHVDIAILKHVEIIKLWDMMRYDDEWYVNA